MVKFMKHIMRRVAKPTNKMRNKITNVVLAVLPDGCGSHVARWWMSERGDQVGPAPWGSVYAVFLN